MPAEYLVSCDFCNSTDPNTHKANVVVFVIISLSLEAKEVDVC